MGSDGMVQAPLDLVGHHEDHAYYLREVEVSPGAFGCGEVGVDMAPVRQDAAGSVEGTGSKQPAWQVMGQKVSAMIGEMRVVAGAECTWQVESVDVTGVPGMPLTLGLRSALDGWGAPDRLSRLRMPGGWMTVRRWVWVCQV